LFDCLPYTKSSVAQNLDKTESVFIPDYKFGDKIDIYYYEQSSTHDEGINRFTQFIDHQGIPYFIRDGFQRNAGYGIIGLGILMATGGFMLKKKGVIN